MNSNKKLLIKNKELLPIVQGGMGIGISASGLASAVARENCIGTIASVDLRHLHEDLLEESKKIKETENYNIINRIALDREIKSALEKSNGKGMIAVNVMKAVNDYVGLTRQACESGANAIAMGAGLPLELPDIVSNFKNVALFPILSESRGINIVLKRWMKKNRLPDAIIIENPNHAAGHLGATNINDLNNNKFNFETVILETREIFKNLGLESEKIPLILAGGMANFQKIKIAISEWGVSGVQVGTAFAVTKECDAHVNFKETLANAKDDDIAEFMSVAGLPARGILTPFLKNYISREKKLQDNAKNDPRRCTQNINCLSTCGLRDGISKIGQFCIDLKLAAAFRGEVNKGLFFRGKDQLPFGNNICTVKETIDYLLTGKIKINKINVVVE